MIKEISHSNLYTNALYLRMFRKGDTSRFLCAKPKKSDYDSLSANDKAIVNIMTLHEAEMKSNGQRWNEDGLGDYESSFRWLIKTADDIIRMYPRIPSVHLQKIISETMTW